MDKKLISLFLLLGLFLFLFGCPGEPVCGDNICQTVVSNTDESNPSSAYYCPSDCGIENYCGDYKCTYPEDEQSCPKDCGQNDFCGDGLCKGNETQNTCPSDCGKPPNLCGNGVIDPNENCEANSDCVNTQICNRQSCLCQEKPADMCNSESDKGFNSIIKGQATFEQYNSLTGNLDITLVGEEDRCVNETTLREATCEYDYAAQTPIPTYTEVICPNGCMDGKCVLEEGMQFCALGDLQNCTVIDENSSCGQEGSVTNAYVQNSIYLNSIWGSWDSGKTIKSQCLNEQKLIKYSCNAYTTDNADRFRIPFSTELTCPQNYLCDDGKCVEKDNNLSNRIIGNFSVGDLTRDGNYNLRDLNALKVLISNSASAYDSLGDLDRDGLVDVYDEYLMQKELSGSNFRIGQELPLRSFWQESFYSLLGQDEKTGYLREKDKLDMNWETCLEEAFNGNCGIALWANKYSQVGASRMKCIPPVLKVNLTNVNSNTRLWGFDRTIKYDQFRMVPDCDIWYSQEADNLIREYFIYWIFKRHNVPTFQTIAFANIKLTSTDNVIDSNATYHYLFLQNPKSEKDTVPFQTEYRFSELLDDDIMYARQGNYTWSEVNRFLGMQVNYPDHNEMMDFDPETAIRYQLLTNFTNLGDRSLFHNEMYGKNIDNNYWKQIPFDFDMSFSCGLSYPNVGYLISQIPEEKKQQYNDIYYFVAREIFSDTNNLNEMLLEIDKYPLNSNKTKMKNFIKTQFYNYALYFNSENFAQDMNKTYVPLKDANIFVREARRILSTQNLDILCADQYPQSGLYNWVN